MDPSLFVNDGSFMEKFKQLQKEKEEKENAAMTESKSNASNGASIPSKTGVLLKKRPLDVKRDEKIKPNTPSSGGKLAFSLKQKSKVVAPVKLVEDEEDDREVESGQSEDTAKRQKLGKPDVSETSVVKGDVVPSPPSDPTMKQVADRLASLVAKNGRQFEHITRQRNPGDTPFKFLFDSSCSDYKYYEYRLSEEEKLIAQSKECQTSQTVDAVTSRFQSSSQRNSFREHSSFQTPASALYEAKLDGSSLTASADRGESSAPPSSDPIAMMEFYMKKAAQEERKRPPKQSKDEMPPPASLQVPPKKGHHMGDYIPPEELEKFLANCNDAAAQRAAREAAEKSKIHADNVGHKLLSKMGWKEGEGLGTSNTGRADPVMAGEVKMNNLGVGAEHPGEVKPDDDIYEQYKKRMMLGYRYRPNPLGNPRKQYY